MLRILVLLSLTMSLVSCVEEEGAKVLGLRLKTVTSSQSYNEEGVISVMAGQQIDIEVIGVNLSPEVNLKLTTAVMEAGDNCDTGSSETKIHSPSFLLRSGLGEEEGHFLKLNENGTKNVIFSSSADTYRVCVQSANGTWVYQGDSPGLRIQFYAPGLPIWLMICLVSVLLCLSGLFSGLNLGLMALDQTELQIVIKTGTEQEQEDAKAILPVRKLGNFLLCSLLLGNVLVNNSLTIMLDSLTGGGGLIAVIGSTMGIVVFGEIIPQALCSRHGLAVGAKTLIITKFFMAVTSPLSFPISKILDCILGEELGTVYNRERLIELLRVTGDNTDLNKDEVNILTGALVLQQKTVKEIMTPLVDSYMLPLDSVLDFETISEIKSKGYSRIPVYDKDESRIVYILLAKDLLFVDPDDKKPLEEVCKFYKTPFSLVDETTHLNTLLDVFKTGEKGHLAMVHDPSDTESSIGLVTLEDIIEEIIQAEIVDETDIVTDNKTRKKRRSRSKFVNKEKEFQLFVGDVTNRVEVSPQAVHAVLQFLSTSITAFSSANIKTEILQKLLNLDVFRDLKFKDEEDARQRPILENGKPCDHFILIVEGKVEVQIGNEGYKFESGPFTSFGKQILDSVLSETLSSDTKSPSKVTTSWTPECTIVAKTDVLWLKVKQATFRNAVRASRVDLVDMANSETVETALESMARCVSSVSENSQVAREYDPLI